MDAIIIGVSLFFGRRAVGNATGTPTDSSVEIEKLRQRFHGLKRTLAGIRVSGFTVEQLAEACEFVSGKRDPDVTNTPKSLLQEILKEGNNRMEKLLATVLASAVNERGGKDPMRT